MICKPVKRTLLDEFRADRGQSTEAPKVTPTPPSRRRRDNTPYDSFLRKYNSLEETIDDLGTRDLVYYFREVAEENGFKYVIANMKKDMAIMKRLREQYSNREICGMIEFMYESEQDYLDKKRLSPNVLASQWVNTVYADMQLWVEDKYVPRKSKPKYSPKGEWNYDDNEKTTIGLKL